MPTIADSEPFVRPLLPTTFTPQDNCELDSESVSDAVSGRDLPEHLLQLPRGQQVALDEGSLEAVEVAAGGDDVAGRAQPRHVLFGGVVDLGVGGVLVEQGVADGVGLRHVGCRAGERRPVQLQRPEDAARDLLGVAAAGDLLDDHARDDEVGVRVRRFVLRAGPRWLPQSDRHELLGRVGVVPVLGESGPRGVEAEVGVVGVVREAAGVVEEPAQGDLGAVVAVAAQQAGQPSLHRVVQAQFAFRTCASWSPRGRGCPLGDQDARLRLQG
ncbi:hypothetical protein GCM10010103_71380 [Streptomyces paradoxus]